jgi:hypothetical protein
LALRKARLRFRRSHDRRTEQLAFPAAELVLGKKAIPAAATIGNMANRNSEAIVQAMVRLTGYAYVAFWVAFFVHAVVAQN